MLLLETDIRYQGFPTPPTRQPQPPGPSRPPPPYQSHLSIVVVQRLQSFGKLGPCLRQQWLRSSRPSRSRWRALMPTPSMHVLLIHQECIPKTTRTSLPNKFSRSETERRSPLRSIRSNFRRAASRTDGLRSGHKCQPEDQRQEVV